MLGSPALEVGIGLILIFLLVSLILTAVRETLEGWFRTRARDLEQALGELLNDPSGDGLRAQLYAHPLIASLYRGEASPTTFANGKVAARGGRNLPSYIPREAFATALDHLLSEGHGNERVGQAYAALVRASDGDAARIRAGLEQWYDASMDRAAGWYKRRTQSILFFLGVGIAILLNINAITIAHYLATNPVAQQQVVRIADDLRRDPAVKSALTAPNPPAPARTQEAGTPGNSAAAGDNTAAGNATAANESSPAENGQPATKQSAGATSSLPAPVAIARRLDSELDGIGLPIGWDAVERDRFLQQFPSDGSWWGWLAALVSLIAGYLMVGLAATLGAPFWFDLLGKFMVVRSTVKPTEKSRDEASKDGGTGGAPQSASATAPADGAPPAPRGPGFTSPIPDRAMDAPEPVIFG